MKIKLIAIIILKFLFLINGEASRDHVLINQINSKNYSPVNYGLESLIFEARIQELNIPDHLEINSENISFKIYWLKSKGISIEVIGMPDGFKEIKDSFKRVIYPYLNYIFSQKIIEVPNGYDVKIKTENEERKHLVVFDPSYQNEASHIDVIYEEKNYRISFTVKSPRAVFTQIRENSPKSWSQNKWSLDKAISVVRRDEGEHRLEADIDYLEKDTMGFPSKIRISERYFLNENKKKSPRLIRNEIHFFNYQIDLKAVQKHFQKIKK